MNRKSATAAYLSAGTAVAFVTALVVACGTNDPGAAGDGKLPTATYCGTPNEGCPCDEPGKIVDCGSVKIQSGDQVSCSMGTRTCEAGRWGACNGNHIVVKTVSVTPTDVSGDLRTMALTQGPCPPPPSPLSNVCDPYCNQAIETTPILSGPPSGPPACGGATNKTALYSLLWGGGQGNETPTCTPGAGQRCRHDYRCDSGTSACRPFNTSEVESACATEDLTLGLGCWNGTGWELNVCNRGGAPTAAGVVKISVHNGTPAGAANTCPFPAVGGPAAVGECNVNLGATPLAPGQCIPFPLAGNCNTLPAPGGPITLSGNHFFVINPPTALLAGYTPRAECNACNNYTAVDDGDKSDPAAACQACAPASANVTLQTTNNGQSGCTPGPEMSGTTCTVATQYQDCQQDFRCVGGTCVWNGGEGYYDSTVPTADLTIGAACITGGVEFIPVCNRGSATIPPSSTLNVHIGTSSPAPDSCVPTGPPTCSGQAPAAGLPPGKCINVTCAIPGNKYAIVSAPSLPVGVAEVGNLCKNNQAFVKTGGSCASCTLCNTRISGKVYDPSSGAPAIAGANNLPLAGITVFQPAGALSTLTDGVSCDTCASTDSPSIAKTVTDATGSFTLSGATPSANTRVVVQSGRWRREVSVPVTACADNILALGTLRMPRDRTDSPTGTANIPKTALVTGNQESLACLFRKLGISASEIQRRTGPGDLHRFQLYRDNGMDYAGGAPAFSTLLNAATMSEYAAVIQDCDGSSTNGGYSSGLTAGERTVMRNFVDAGGRMFADHWNGIAPLMSAQFLPTATLTGGDVPAGMPAAGRVLVGTPPQQLFSDWLNAVAATTTYGPGWINVATPRRNLFNPGPGTVHWVAGRNNDTWGTGAPPAAPTNPADYTLSYSFETPLSSTCAGGGTGRFIFNGMHVSGARGTTGTFPGSCSIAAALTEEEKALVYQLFQLTACQLGGAPPPPPPPPLPPLEVFRDIEAICPVGTYPEWGFFFWQSTTPPGTSIQFRAATAVDQPSLPPSPPAPAPTTVSAGTANPPSIAAPSWGSDANTIAWHLTNDPPGPAKSSSRWLRIYIRMNPSGAVGPSLDSYRQDYSCKPAE